MTPEGLNLKKDETKTREEREGELVEEGKKRNFAEKKKCLWERTCRSLKDFFSEKNRKQDVTRGEKTKQRWGGATAPVDQGDHNSREDQRLVETERTTCSRGKLSGLSGNP